MTPASALLGNNKKTSFELLSKMHAVRLNLRKIIYRVIQQRNNTRLKTVNEIFEIRLVLRCSTVRVIINN